MDVCALGRRELAAAIPSGLSFIRTCQSDVLVVDAEGNKRPGQHDR